MSFVHLHRQHIRLDKETGCWLWNGQVQSNGYGYYGKERAHRWVWKQLVGALSRSDVLDHEHCENKICVNPDHLTKTTHAEHNRRHKLGKKMTLSETETRRRQAHGKKMIVHAQNNSYSKRTRSDVSKETWSKRTPEERAAIGAKISAAKRGDA